MGEAGCHISSGSASALNVKSAAVSMKFHVPKPKQSVQLADDQIDAAIEHAERVAEAAQIGAKRRRHRGPKLSKHSKTVLEAAAAKNGPTGFVPPPPRSSKMDM